MVQCMTFGIVYPKDIERLRIEKKNLELCVDIDPKLPSVLLGDEKRLKQIFLNSVPNLRVWSLVSPCSRKETEAEREGTITIFTDNEGIIFIVCSRIHSLLYEINSS